MLGTTRIQRGGRQDEGQGVGEKMRQKAIERGLPKDVHGRHKKTNIRVGGGHDNIKERVRWWMGMEGRGEVKMVAWL